MPHRKMSHSKKAEGEQTSAEQAITADEKAQDATAQTLFADEVKHIQDEVTRLAAETVEEGRGARHTAAQAIGYFHVKLRKLAGEWT